ncbi:MAG: aldo/keto reductase [Lachnospiraceae bacterium]|nr:aldo/keto reductase [Lachnospiraceae bacterium]
MAVMEINQEKIPTVRLFDGQLAPCIGMGTFGSDHASPVKVKEAVYGAIRYGYRFFDCASVYGNEAEIGEIFTKAVSEGIVRRGELFITSKVWNDRHGKGDVLISLAQTLKDLQLDYVDCYFVHWPFPNYHAPGCDADSRNPGAKPFKAGQFMEVWQQMEKIADMGLSRYIGMSNMTIPKLEAVLPLCRIKPAFIEMEFHPSFQQKELLDYCFKHGIKPIGFCPLGSPNRPVRDKTPDDVVDTELTEVVNVAAARGIHPALVCLKWAVQKGVIPIPFSTNEKNYQANLRCVTEGLLKKSEMELLEKAERNCRLVKGQVFLWPEAKGWQDLWD